MNGSPNYTMAEAARRCHDYKAQRDQDREIRKPYLGGLQWTEAELEAMMEGIETRINNGSIQLQGHRDWLLESPKPSTWRALLDIAGFAVLTALAGIALLVLLVLLSAIFAPAAFGQSNDGYTNCLIKGFGDDAGGQYGWTVAHGGSAQRSGRGYFDNEARRWTDLATVPSGPLTCHALGIDPNEFVRARWIWLMRLDDDGRTRTVRIHPSRGACRADFDGSGTVDERDVTVFRSSFFLNICHRGRCAADLNGDGSVNTADMGIFGQLIGGSC